MLAPVTVAKAASDWVPVPQGAEWLVAWSFHLVPRNPVATATWWPSRAKTGTPTLGVMTGAEPGPVCAQAADLRLCSG